jgi:hypothetical protein
LKFEAFEACLNNPHLQQQHPQHVIQRIKNIISKTKKKKNNASLG